MVILRVASRCSINGLTVLALGARRGNYRASMSAIRRRPTASVTSLALSAGVDTTMTAFEILCSKRQRRSIAASLLGSVESTMIISLKTLRICRFIASVNQELRKQLNVSNNRQMINIIRQELREMATPRKYRAKLVPSSCFTSAHFKCALMGEQVFDQSDSASMA